MIRDSSTTRSLKNSKDEATKGIDELALGLSIDLEMMTSKGEKYSKFGLTEEVDAPSFHRRSDSRGR